MDGQAPARKIEHSEIVGLALAASQAIDNGIAELRKEVALTVTDNDLDRVLMSLVAARANKITTRTYAAGERGG